MTYIMSEEMELIEKLVAEEFTFKVTYLNQSMRIYVYADDGVEVRVSFSPELCDMADNYWYVRDCGNICEFSNVDDVMDCIRKWRA